MIKARGTNERGQNVLVLGLTRANCSRLLAGMPIKFDANPYGIDAEILICAGADEKALATAILGSADDPRIKPDPDGNAQ
jgi:hypothetical protein